jgi:N6-adenosine-specific RNA methylase IME4
MDRSAENHYPTSSTDDICKRDIPSIAAKDCVLFLWATVPMLPDALKVMEAWGEKLNPFMDTSRLFKIFACYLSVNAALFSRAI